MILVVRVPVIMPAPSTTPRSPDSRGARRPRRKSRPQTPPTPGSAGRPIDSTAMMIATSPSPSALENPARSPTLPGAECESRIVLMAARILIGQCGDRQRTGMRRHVHAVGQERHRSEDHPGGDLDDHHDEGDGHDDPRTAGVAIVMRAQKFVRLPGRARGRCWKPLQILHGTVVVEAHRVPPRRLYDGFCSRWCPKTGLIGNAVQIRGCPCNCKRRVRRVLRSDRASHWATPSSDPGRCASNDDSQSQ